MERKKKYGQMNNRLILSCRDEMKQNFMAYSYAGDLPIEIIYIVNLIDPYARCAGEFRSLKKEKKILCFVVTQTDQAKLKNMMRRERLHRKIEKKMTRRDKQIIIIIEI